MQTRRLYLGLAIVGAIVPMTQFVPWLAVHGMDPGLFGRELFANRISSFFALDLLLTAVVVVVLAARERGRLKLWWLPILLTCLIGVSAGLPLLLYLREPPDANR